MIARRIYLVLGCIFLLFIPFWVYGVFPLIAALPANFYQKINLVHTEDSRFEIGGKWSGKTISLASVEEKSINTEFEKSKIETKFNVESLKGEPLFVLKQNFAVNRRTFHNFAEGVDTKGEAYLFFPRNVKKQVYHWWPDSFGEPFDVSFVDVQKVGNLTTYHFRGERSNINDSEGYSFLPLVPEKYLALSRAVLDVYVEPFTGMIVDYQDSGTSYYADNARRPIWDISMWSNKYNQDAVNERISLIQDLKLRMFMQQVLIPLIALTIGLYFLIHAFTMPTTRGKSKKR